ncbi:hypothetical protein ES703_82238 [subsurface metagenome]
MYERMLCYCQGSLVGISSALYPDRLEARLVHCLCDGLSAAVDDNRLHPDGGHKGDIGQQLFLQRSIFEDAAAEFDNHDSPPKPADIFHRLDERTSFCNSFLHDNDS